VTVFPRQRSVPVSRKESRALPFFFHRGNPGRFPFRWPFLDLTKSPSARSRLRNASWYTHFEFSAHQARAGSAFFSAFHRLCSSAAPYHFRSAAYRSFTFRRPQFQANRAAPACDRRARSCAGAGSSANLYACRTAVTGRPRPGAPPRQLVPWRSSRRPLSAGQPSPCATSLALNWFV
jgi:hypothetical protein